MSRSQHRSHAIAVVVAVAAIAVALLAAASAGQVSGGPAAAPPAFALVQAGTIGVPGVPFLRSAAQLDQPWGVTTDADRAWIADSAGRRLLQFSSSGAYLGEIGRAGLTWGIGPVPVRFVADAAVSHPLAPGADPRDPSAPRLDLVWYADSAAHYVAAVDQAGGDIVRVLGTPDEPGADDDHLRAPSGLAVDAAGRVFVSDTGNHRIVAFDANGTVLGQIGTTGTPGAGPAELRDPARISIGPDGRLYVADAGNHRVQAFDVSDPAAPRLVDTYGRSGSPGAGPDRFDRPLGVHAAATFLFVADSGNCRVQVVQIREHTVFRTYGRAGGCAAAGDMGRASDVALDSAFNVWIADPERFVVHQYASSSGALAATFGTDGLPYATDADHLNEPAGVAVAADGGVALLERAGSRLQRRGPDGAAVWSLGRPGVAGSGPLELRAAEDVALDAAGRAVVADTGNHRVLVVTADGRGAVTVGTRGAADGQLESPEGVAVAPDGRIVVADTGNRRVQVFGSDGRYASQLSRGFARPADVAVDGRGRLYVADAARHVVEAFDAGGALVATIGMPGVSGDDFAHLDRPSRLAVDAANRLYVSDTGNDRVVAFAADGAFLTVVGGRAGLGSGELREPLGLAVGSDGRLVVADSGNHRVQVLVPPPEPWSASAPNGLGRRDTAAVTALASFGGALYAGDAAEGRRATVWRQDVGSGAWSDAGLGGVVDADDSSVADMVVFGGRLYVGTASERTTVDPTTGQTSRTTTGGSLWRTADGRAFERVAPAGFGSAWNASVRSLAEFRGGLYAGTAVIAESRSAEVWRSADGAPGTWTRSVGGGIADTSNSAVAAMQVFTGSLYAGTCSRAGAGRIYRSTNGITWAEAGTGGPTIDARGAPCVIALAEFDGYLYAALGNDARLAPTRGQLGLWRCRACDGSDWAQAAPAGMGRFGNRGRASMLAFDEPPFRFLYLAVGNADGLEVWRTSDGDEWEPSQLGGFGDNVSAEPGGVRALAAHDGRLHLAVANAAGGAEVWSTAGSRPGTIRPTPVPGGTPTPRPRPEPPTGRAAYQLVDQWPPGAVVPPDAIDEIVDVAVGDDGAVFLADATNNRVMRISAAGEWLEPVGNVGRGPDRVGQVGSVAVDAGAARLYVGDLASERLLVFGTDGRLLDAWPGIYAIGMAPAPNGRIWVADRVTGAVRRLAPDGTEEARFGSFGDREGDQFRGLQDVAVDPDGDLYVSDRNGDRLRGFHPQPGGGYKQYRTIWFADDPNTVIEEGAPQFENCSAVRIQALGPERILADRCVIQDGRREDLLPLQLRGSDLYEIAMRAASASAGYFVALATYDPDPNDDADLSYPVVARFRDDRFALATGTVRGRVVEAPDAAASGEIRGPTRLSTAPDGTLMLSDDFGLRQIAPDGRLVEQLPVERYPSRRNRLDFMTELAVGEGSGGRVMIVGRLPFGGREGFLQAVRAETELRRYCDPGTRRCAVNRYLKTISESVLPADTEAVAAVAHEPTRNQFVLLTRYRAEPRLQASRIVMYAADFFGHRQTVDLEGDDTNTLWADVDAGPTGRIYVLDTLNDRIQVLGPRAESLGQVPTPKDAWRVAGGPNDEIYVLTVYGHVVRLAADGTVLGRFVARPHEGVPPTSLVDIAVDASGWAYAVDELANQVTVFAPRGVESDVLEGATCEVAGDKWATPRDVLLGETVTVYLKLFGTCGAVETPADIVLAIDTRGGVDGLSWPLLGQLGVARQIAALTDLDRHRLAVVAYAKDANVVQPLTHEGFRIVRALRNAHAGRGEPSEPQAGLLAASQLFDPPGPRLRVIVLVRSGETDANAIALAERLKADAVRILVVNDDSGVASSDLYNDIDVDARAMGAGRPVHRRMVDRFRPEHLVRSGQLVDRLPANMRYVVGSAQPPAAWDAAARTLTWPLSDVDLPGSTELRLEVEPLAEGEWPTNVEAAADYTDGWDHTGRVVLPVPRVRVYGRYPTATPTASPTETATPEPTPTPRPTAVPVPVYLPLALRVPCKAEDRNADVALVIDTSGSMSDPTSPGGQTKLEAARDAARRFLLQLAADRDQASVIQFNTTVEVLVPLTDDPAVAAAGLDRLTQAGGTRIDLAFEAARAVLTGPGRRAGNNPVAIVLTDGEPTGTTRQAVLAAAEATRGAGILVFTIGLGPDVDHDLLAACAGSAGWYFHAPATTDLAAIYDRIASEVPCVPVWP